MDEQVKAALLSLKRSAFRSGFRLSTKDLSYFHEKGIDTIRRDAFDFITTRIFKWHRIPKGRVLKNPEIDFIVNLVVVWIEHQARVSA